MAATTEDGAMKYYVSRLELSTHLAKRIDYHIQKNDEYLKEAAKINDDMEAELAEQENVTARMSLKSNASYLNNGNRRDQFRNSARGHATKATVMKFAMDHLPAEEGFLLSVHELTALELIPQAY